MHHPDLKIQILPLGTVKPYWRNPRRHTEEGIRHLKASLQEFGCQQPLVIDHEMVLIVGHARYKAMIELGWTEAPVVVADLDPSHAAAYRIADNASAQWSTWDEPSLIAELLNLDGDIGKLVHDSIPDVEKLLRDLQQQPEPAVAVEPDPHDEHEIDQDPTEENETREFVCPECGETFTLQV